jgi:CHAD domain-containing protein
MGLVHHSAASPGIALLLPAAERVPVQSSCQKLGNQHDRSMEGDLEKAEQMNQDVHFGLRPGVPLTRALALAFEDMVDHARAQAAGVAGDPVRAVHEYRKAIRRARALMCLLRGVLGVKAHEQIAKTLRDAHRAASDLRDRHVLVLTLDRLEPGEDEAALVAALRAALAAAEPEQAGAAQAVLDQGSAVLEGLPALLAGALPPRVRWRDLDEGLRATHGRARQAMHEAWKQGADELVHAWRKRNKELVYQVELLSSAGADDRLHRLHRRLDRLSKELGQVVDLMVLRQHVREHASEEQREPVLRLIAPAQASHLQAARRRGKRYANARPGKFAGKVVERARRARKVAERRRRLAP